MEYPGATFIRPLRRAVLFLFIATFFIAAPLVVLYTTGYRYDFKNGLWRETGSLSVDVEPATARVSLDNLALPDVLPIRLKDIIPHKYNLKISAPGYYDWQKEIDIKNKQTTYIKEVVLLKKSQPREIVRGKVSALGVSHDGQYLLYSLNQDTHTPIFLRDTATGQNTIVADFPGPEPPQIVWARKNNTAVIAAPQQAPFTRLMVVTADNLTKTRDLTPVAGGPIAAFEWRDSVEAELYYSTPGTIASFFPITGQKRTITKNSYLGWRVEQGGLWTLSAATTTASLTITKDTIGFSKTFATVPLPAESPTMADPAQWRLLSAENDTVLLGNKAAAKMFIVRPDKQFTVSATALLLSPYNHWWLLSSPSELWTYSDGDEPYLLTRSGESLRGVAPLDQYNTLAIYSDKTVSFIFPYYLVQHDMVKHGVAALSADTTNRVLYFGDQNGLWSLTY
ncbi:MAG: PEGA domain-containing protein [Candidatus Magasanikbacteria bacterium]|nr:PEGA domain-containing protein [Candidatus Magasanikbacteria bacterium]